MWKVEHSTVAFVKEKKCVKNHQKYSTFVASTQNASNTSSSDRQSAPEYWIDRCKTMRPRKSNTTGILAMAVKLWVKLNQTWYYPTTWKRKLAEKGARKYTASHVGPWRNYTVSCIFHVPLVLELIQHASSYIEWSEILIKVWTPPFFFWRLVLLVVAFSNLVGSHSEINPDACLGWVHVVVGLRKLFGVHSELHLFASAREAGSALSLLKTK